MQYNYEGQFREFIKLIDENMNYKYELKIIDNPDLSNLKDFNCILNNSYYKIYYHTTGALTSKGRIRYIHTSHVKIHI